MRRRDFLFSLPLVVGSLGMLGLGTMMLTRLREGSERKIPSPREGLPAPLDTVGSPWPGLENRALRLSDLSAPGRPLVLWFWASWCPACAQSVSGLAAIVAEGWFLAGVLWRDTPVRGIAALRTWGDVYHRLVYDADGRLGESWGIFGVPEGFLIGADGIVRRRLTGVLTPDRVVRDLRPWV